MKKITTIVAIAVLTAGCTYIAGSGEAPQAARDWADEHVVAGRSGLRVSTSCTGRDTDNDGYVSCTLTVVDASTQDEHQWPTETHTLECGVNHPLSGCATTGCKPSFGSGTVKGGGRR